MTSPLSPPKRRRRRIIVTSIAVFLLGTGWWFWPRVDQRFVGAWRCGDWTMQFHDDGSVENFAEFAATGQQILMVTGAVRFRVVGNRFIVSDGVQGLQSLLFEFQSLFMPQRYGPIYEGEVVEIGPKTLKLKGAESDELMILERADEFAAPSAPTATPDTRRL